MAAGLDDRQAEARTASDAWSAMTTLTQRLFPLEPQYRERVWGGVELKRWRACIVEYQQLSRLDFDVASRELRIACILRARHH